MRFWEHKFKDLANETAALNERKKALVAEIKGCFGRYGFACITPFAYARVGRMAPRGLEVHNLQHNIQHTSGTLLLLRRAGADQEHRL
jgi:hypothetical protein